MKSAEHTTIKELYIKNEINSRVYNICRYNNINTIEDLVNYFAQNGTFKKIRNNGKISNTKLEYLCNKYSKLPIITNTTIVTLIQ